MIDMADYTQVTKEGYEIKRLFQVKQNVNSNPFLIAVIYRPKADHPYLWAWDYDPRTGAWGAGHYDYDSITQAVKGLTKAYYKAKPISPNALIWLKSDYMERDGFGWYSMNDQKQLFSNAYRISKSRGDTLKFVTPTGRVEGTIHWHATRKMSIYIPKFNKSKSIFRVYADGRVEPM